jgi:hypothetical protein
MTIKETVEEKLEKLGLAIGSDDSLVEDVMSRVDTATFCESDRINNKLVRRIIKSPFMKLAAAAVIIIAVTIVVTWLGSSIEGSSVALGKVMENMKKMPWEHVFSQIQREGHKEESQFWYSFTPKIEAGKEQNGKLTFYDYSRQVAYAYDPCTEQITIYSLRERKFALGAESPWEWLEKMVEVLSEHEGTRVTRKNDKYDGRDVEIYTVRVPKGHKGSKGVEEWLFVVDSDTHLIMTLKLRGYKPDGNVIEWGEMTFDYPDDGPADIYELGAPGSAAVIDDRTKPEAEEIFNTYTVYRQNAPSRYIAVSMNYHHIERIGADVIDQVERVYTDGRLQRYEKYQLVDWLEYLDNWPKYSAQMGNTFDSQLKWWTQGEHSGCRLITLYDNEYHYMLSCDLKTKKWSANSPEHYPEREYLLSGLGSWGWPLYRLSLGVPGEPPITVIEDEYSKRNKLICLQRLWQGQVYKGSVTLPCKSLWYLNPQRDYICQVFVEHYLRNAPWQRYKSWLEGVDPNRIPEEKTRWGREVTEFGQTDTGQWYPKRIGTNPIFLDTDPEFPEGIFDPETLPKGNE